uniref:Isocitrate dehydrogenase [NAD] subunit beta, mitochondrial n=1 Tax=Callithrix jacchus TaxID=9483 RepID=A0A2R8M563_CALJA
MAALSGVRWLTRALVSAGNPGAWRGLSTSAAAHAALRSQAEDVRVEGSFPVTMLPGDGVGPELMHAVKEVFKAAAVPVEFQEHHLSEVQNMASEEKLEQVLSSMKENKVAIIGKIHTPMEYKGELASYDMRLRRKLDLFANVVHVKSLPGYMTRHNNLDLVIIREQTEGEYSSLEHESARGVIECLKIVTRAKSQRIAKFAFDYATKKGRGKVTAVHKANIMKLGDGLFLQCCEEVAELYPKIKFETMIIDNCCMQLVQNPYQFDVLVMPNLYGNIIDNLAAGLVGGAGVVPGESYSAEYAVFETSRVSLQHDCRCGKEGDQSWQDPICCSLFPAPFTALFVGHLNAELAAFPGGGTARDTGRLRHQLHLHIPSPFPCLVLSSRLVLSYFFQGRFEPLTWVAMLLAMTSLRLSLLPCPTHRPCPYPSKVFNKKHEPPTFVSLFLLGNRTQGGECHLGLWYAPPP